MNIRHNDKEIEQLTHSWPQYDEEQIEDVVAVLRSGKVNAWTGNKVREFEAGIRGTARPPACDRACQRDRCA